MGGWATPERMVCGLLAVILLLGASATMLVAAGRMPIWVAPASAASIGLSTTLLPVSALRASTGDLLEPLLFLLFAVPLAVALDDLGVFEAVAAAVDHRRHLVGWAWWIAAAVVALLNLDTAVVLLTPLYVRLARRRGLRPEALAFQPALLACLASGVLPVSNLTNLIVAEKYQLGVGDFLANLALPSLAAVLVGYWRYRVVFPAEHETVLVDLPVDRRALRRGLPIIAFVVAGFTVGDLASVPAWSVALAALVWASALTRRARWRSAPVGAIVTAASFGGLVAAAAPHLPLDHVFSGSGGVHDLRIVAFATVGSNMANNLPLVIAGAGAAQSTDQVWPLLLGANIGSVLLVTGSLSTLLWRETAQRVGLHVSMRRHSAVAVRVGLPALAAATIVAAL